MSRPGFWKRLRLATRAAWWDDNVGAFAHHDPMMDSGAAGLGTSQLRRSAMTNHDLQVLYSALFAVIRKRSTAVNRPVIRLMRRGRAGGAATEVNDHPALKALRRVNESMTAGQGFGLIEQHKCGSGEAFWIKRRRNNRPGGETVEFEIWNPQQVKIEPRKDRPWVPLQFKKRELNGSETTVGPEDVIWMRHMVDPRFSLGSLSPVGAVRMLVTTSMEGARVNQAFLDNDANPSVLYSSPDAEQGEVERLEQEFEARFRGPDKKGKLAIYAGELKEVTSVMSMKDMQYMEQMTWTRGEVASVFEIAPVLIGDLTQATKENLRHFEADFWTMILTQVMSTLGEMEEFWLTPEYGDEFFFDADASMIPALQVDMVTRARADDIYLKDGKVTINELRERDNEKPVDWGDVPLIPSTLSPLSDEEEEPAEGSFPNLPAAPPDEAAIRVVTLRTLQDAEDTMAAGWEARLRQELRGIIAHLRDADRRGDAERLTPDDALSYDWDGWWDRHRRTVQAELRVSYLTALSEAGFQETVLLPAQQAAASYAQRAAAELLQVTGSRALVSATREGVRAQVVRAIEEGIGPRQLANRLREDFIFSASRADMIARTEMAFANSQASLQSYQSLGHEGKEWLTAGDDRVDAGKGPTPCLNNEAEGAIALGKPFQSGHDAPPAHPRCRCTILPVRELPTRTVKLPERDDDGRILRVVEVSG